MGLHHPRHQCYHLNMGRVDTINVFGIFTGMVVCGNMSTIARVCGNRSILHNIKLNIICLVF